MRTGFCALPPRGFHAVKVVAKGAVFRGHILTGRAAREGDGEGRGGPDSRSARVLDFPALAMG